MPDEFVQTQANDLTDDLWRAMSISIGTGMEAKQAFTLCISTQVEFFYQRLGSKAVEIASLRRYLDRLLYAVDGDHMTACEKTMGDSHPCTCGATEIRLRLAHSELPAGDGD